MINRCLSYLYSKKETINRFLPIFLASYLVLLLFPYVFSYVTPLDNFFTSGVSQVIYRAIVTAYALGYLLVVGIANKIRINKYFIIGGSILILSFIISCIIGPHIIYDNDGSIFITTEWWWYFLGIIRMAINIILFIMTISFVHIIMKDVKCLYIALYILIGTTIFACLMSFILEGKELIALFNGIDEHSLAIHSIFHSKNEFGLFLFIGTLATAFILFTNIEKLKYYFLFIPLLLFTFMTILIGCRTAFAACMMLVVYLFIRSLLLLRIDDKKIFYIFISIISALIVLFILYMTIPVFHEGSMGGLYKIVIYTFTKFGNALDDRMEIWQGTFRFMKGHYLVFGANTTNSTYLLMVNSNHHDFHSGYVRWFATTGLIGTLIYLALFGYIIYLIIKAIKKAPLSGVLALIFLLSSMVYSLSESAVLFISTSMYTFVTNMVIIVYLNYLLKEDNTPKSVNTK